jgi:NADH-quinone oxidoreductase subunit J
MAEIWQQIVVALLGLTMAFSALMVVTSRNVVHAALWLVGALMSAAAMYVVLFAEFVAWVQVLVYVGAIVVLMLFGLMLTRAPIGSADFDNDQRLLAAVCAGAIFLVTSTIVIIAFDGKEIDFVRSRGISSEAIGASIFSGYVLPFEVISVLLLAALVGAVVIARRD